MPAPVEVLVQQQREEPDVDPIDQALADAPANKYGRGLKGCVDLAAQRHPDRAEAILRAVEASHELGCTVVERILRDEGIVLGAQAIGRHRRGDCTCTTR